MRFIGVDLHKQTISLCVTMVEAGKRKVVARKRFKCGDPAKIGAPTTLLGASPLFATGCQG